MQEWATPGDVEVYQLWGICCGQSDRVKSDLKYLKQIRGELSITENVPANELFLIILLHQI